MGVQKTAFAGSSKTMRVDEVARELQISRIRAYELCRQVGFPAFRIGKRIIIPKTAFDAWLMNQTKPESERSQGWEE